MNSLSFTAQCNGIARVILSPVLVSSTFKNNETKSVKIEAIWDTGATSSVISPEIARKCNLVSIGKDKVHTAGGVMLQNVYLVDIGLPNGILIKSVRVTEAQEICGADALIGMDIISLGDFAISNFNGKTTFTFRIPSKETIDFVKDSEKQNKKAVEKEIKKKELLLRQHGNEKCPCGSGRKYRYCCGKKEISDLKKKLQSN